jgi:hypothetical protein
MCHASSLTYCVVTELKSDTQGDRDVATTADDLATAEEVARRDYKIWN